MSEAATNPFDDAAYRRWIDRDDTVAALRARIEDLEHERDELKKLLSAGMGIVEELAIALIAAEEARVSR